MYPMLLTYGFAVFMVCLSIHVLVWRTKRPVNDSLMLFVIFVFIPVIISMLPLVLSYGVRFINLSPAEIIMLLFFHLALSTAYIASYPAVQAVSPSLDILLITASSKTKKLTEKDILNNYNDAELVTARVDDLKTSLLVSQRGDCFELTHMGKIIIGIFILYRKMLGLPIGEG